MVKLSIVSFFVNQITFLSHLNVLSFMSRSFQMFIAIATVSGMINPFLAMCIAGLNNSFHGNFPYFFHAASKPRSSPGTPTANPPVNEDKEKHCREKVLKERYTVLIHDNTLSIAFTVCNRVSSPRCINGYQRLI